MQLSIVSYLDSSATIKIRGLQNTLSKITGSTASLHSWQPHITLGDGVRINDGQLDGLITEFQQIGETKPPFAAEVAGISSFDSRPIGAGETSTPYAIYANVVTNPRLNEIVKNVGVITNLYPIWYHMPRPYTPHVTLAFRDLSKDGYAKGLEYLADKNVQLTTTIDHIALVQKTSDADVELTRIKLTKKIG